MKSTPRRTAKHKRAPAKRTKSALARTAGVSRMTLYRWERAAKAEATNSPARPRGGQSTTLPPTMPESSDRGVGPALRRLEEAEVEAYAAMKRAFKSNDPLRIKLARENWLRVSESLRRFDAAIESSRRDSGELLPRAEIEALLSKLAIVWRLAVQASNDRAVTALSGASPGEVLAALQGLNVERILGTSAALHQAFNLPPWMLRALAAGLDGALNDAVGAIGLRANLLTEFFSECADAALHEVDPTKSNSSITTG